MKKLYHENSSDYPRLKTDTLFRDPETKTELCGRCDELIRFITEWQLKDKSVWKMFVNQFKTAPDDFDLGWRGEYFGKMMRGGCIVYGYSRDNELYNVLEAAVLDIITAQDQYGRISTYSMEAELDGWDLWGRKYVMLGLEYFYEICTDDKLKGKIVDALKKQADYLISNLGPEKKSITVCSKRWDGVNSSSILQPFVKLYAITHESRYIEFSKYIIDNGGIENGDLVAEMLDGTVLPKDLTINKAYEVMSFVEGMLEYYRVTEDKRILKAVMQFSNLVRQHETVITGGVACGHEQFNEATVSQSDPENKLTYQETCAAVTWMKLCYNLLCLTGDAEWADFLECAGYNVIWGAVNNDKSFSREGEKSNNLPFDSFNPLIGDSRGHDTSGYKMMEGGCYGCCASIGSCGLGIMPYSQLLLRGDGIALIHYLPGKITAATPSGKATLTLSGNYPIDSKIGIVFEIDTAETFTVALRIPRWSEKIKISVNGQPVTVKSGFTEICREWHDRDEIEIIFDFDIKMQMQNGHMAFKRGPVVLAYDRRIGPLPVGKPKLENGKIMTAPHAKIDFHHLISEGILLENDEVLSLVDYASCGKTWDEDSWLAVWLATEEN